MPDKVEEIRALEAQLRDVRERLSGHRTSRKVLCASGVDTTDLERRIKRLEEEERQDVQVLIGLFFEREKALLMRTIEAREHWQSTLAALRQNRERRDKVLCPPI
jgi:hypothetical protein